MLTQKKKNSCHGHFKLREEPFNIWTRYKDSMGKKYGRFTTINILKYEHFTRKINKTYSHPVCPL